MIGIDTNVLLRVLIDEGHEQNRIAQNLIKNLSPEQPLFVGREVVLELVWVLGSRYAYGRAEIVTVLNWLLQSEEIEVESARVVAEATAAFGKGGPGFADHLIVARNAAEGCTVTYTFDRKAAKIAGAALLA